MTDMIIRRKTLLLICFVLLAFFFSPARAGGGLQLDKAPEERLYTWSDIAQANRNGSGSYCLCVLEESLVVRVDDNIRENDDGRQSCQKNAADKTDLCRKICTDTSGMHRQPLNIRPEGLVIAGRIVQLRLGNLWPLFVWDHKGPRNSNYLADPFTLTHISHGILFFIVWALLGSAIYRTTLPTHWWTIGTILGAILEAAWEISENLPSMIIKFRAGGMSRDYYGDAVINVIGDWIAAVVGYYSCVLSCDRYDMPLQTVIAYGLALFVAMEAALILYQRDCLVLILIHLFVNPQWLIDFQQCESFADWWMLLE